MANFEATRAAKGYGSGAQKKSEWKDALDAVSMAALAKGASTQTMLGYALGKWLTSYLDRGAENRQAAADKSIDDKLRNSQVNGVSQQTNSVTTPNGTTYSTTDTNTYGSAYKSPAQALDALTNAQDRGYGANIDYNKVLGVNPFDKNSYR